jgi:ATP-binding cassette subfamily B protein
MSTTTPGSTEQKPAQLKETERVQAGPGPGRGPFGGGMVGQKANDFGPSAKRLVRRMAPEKTKAMGVVALAVTSSRWSTTCARRATTSRPRWSHR